MKRLLDPDPQRERRGQERLLVVLERRFMRVYAAEIARASIHMINEFKRLGAVPHLPIDHIGRLRAIYADMADISIRAFGGRIVDQGKARGLILERKDFAEFFKRLALEYIQDELIRQRIALVSEATRAQIVRQVIAGQEEGLGVAEIAKGITDALPSITRQRGALIARTETHGAANFGADEAAKATGLQLQKEWVSVEDHRTRDFGEGDGVIDQFSHRAMNGAVAEMDQAFSVPDRFGGFEKMKFPGDPVGSAGNTINCRCAVSHIVKD